MKESLLPIFLANLPSGKTPNSLACCLIYFNACSFGPGSLSVSADKNSSSSSSLLSLTSLSSASTLISCTGYCLLIPTLPNDFYVVSFLL
uniref:Uncharacterized protein n=1 Tax=Meloidogyne enterolobii TaxID=390850 RepID=A0A6V7UTZ0_MELEN|nr:unnamed protein product [Meloidogyne enterolobii]